MTTSAVWFTRCPSPTASSIALATGRLQQAFADVGIELRSLADSPERAVRQSHFTQDQAAQFRQGGLVPPLVAASRGVPLRVLGLSRIPRLQVLAVLPGGPVRQPTDLRGARLGLPRRTGEPVDFWRAHSLSGLLAGLRAAGVGEEEVTWVDLPTDEPYHGDQARPTGGNLWTAHEAARLQRPEVLALVRGEIDVLYTYGPTGLGLLELLGAEVLLSLWPVGPASSGLGTLSVLTAGADLVRATPEVAECYLDQLVRAAGWALTHPDETLRTLAAEEGVPEEWAAATFGRDLDLTPSLDRELVVALQAEADFLFERGFLATALAVEDLVDAGPLETALAARRTGDLVHATSTHHKERP